jgi:hypothetical protein
VKPITFEQEVIVGRDPVRTMRLSDELLGAVDAWAKSHDMGRSEAFRRLLEIGLKAKK